MKERISQALKDALAGLSITNITAKTINTYAERISKTVTDESQIAEAIKADIPVLKDFSANISFEASEAVKKAAPKKEEEPPLEKKTDKDEPAWFTAYKLDQQKQLDALKGETEKSKAEKAKAERTSLIAKKCKDAGIPEWRQNEGFAIAEDADEATIDAYLVTVKKNITTNSLPSNESSLSLSTSDKQLEEVAASVVNNLPDSK